MTITSPNRTRTFTLVFAILVLLALLSYLPSSAQHGPGVSSACKLPRIENVGRGNFELSDFPNAKTLIGKYVLKEGTEQKLLFQNRTSTGTDAIETYVNYDDTRSFTGVFNDEVTTLVTIEEANSVVEFLEIDLHAYDRLLIWSDRFTESAVVDITGIDLLTSTITFTAPYTGSYSIKATGTTSDTIAGSFGFSEPCIDPPAEKSTPMPTETPIPPTPTATVTSTPTTLSTNTPTSTLTLTATITSPIAVSTFVPVPSTSTPEPTPLASPTEVDGMMMCETVKEIVYIGDGNEEGFLDVSPSTRIPLGSTISIVATTTGSTVFDHLMINGTRVDSPEATWTVSSCDIHITAVFQRTPTNLDNVQEPSQRLLFPFISNQGEK